jgi:hypothetical protein
VLQLIHDKRAPEVDGAIRRVEGAAKEVAEPVGE